MPAYHLRGFRQDLAALALGVAGRFAVAVPLAETLMAGWLLTRAGVEAPNGAMTFAPSRSSDRIIFGKDATLSGRAFSIPFASEAQNLAVVAQGERSEERRVGKEGRARRA